MSKKIAKKYIKDIYECGGMSSDIYLIELDEFDSNFNDSDFENKSDLEIKLFILKHLENTGAISGDVYSLELEELGIEENDEY